MFNIFSKKVVHGKKEFDRFKKLVSEREVLEVLIYQTSTGSSNIPLHLTNKVQEAVNLCYSLTSMTSLNAMKLLGAVNNGQWAEIKNLILKHSEAIEFYKDKNLAILTSLIRWADKNNVPEYKQFDAKVYKETGLPRSESELVSLRFVHIPNAGLNEIPKELAALPMVIGICLSDNNIRVIPPEIFVMPSVYRLDLEENFIEEIPEGISHMKQLETLDLDRNNLMRIPESLLLMPSLKSLLVRNQKHGNGLVSPNTPLSDEEVNVLCNLERKGVKLRT